MRKTLKSHLSQSRCEDSKSCQDSGFSGIVRPNEDVKMAEMEGEPFKSFEVIKVNANEMVRCTLWLFR